MNPRIRVGLVHRFQILADVLERAFQGHPQISWVVALTDAATLKDPPSFQKLDVLLIEAALFKGLARRVLRDVQKAQPELKIVPMGLVSNDQIVAHIEAGASGYVAADASFDQLVGTICGVYHNQPPCSSQVAASVSARMVQLSCASPCQEPISVPENIKLTPKEEEVLELAAGGMSNKQIAAELGIAVSTVKIHIHKILGKLQVGKRREAIQLAYEAGLLQDPPAAIPLPPTRN